MDTKLSQVLCHLQCSNISLKRSIAERSSEVVRERTVGLLRVVFHWAEFFARNDIFFCLLTPTLHQLVFKRKKMSKIPPSGK